MEDETSDQTPVKPYDPHEHRSDEYLLSDVQALANLLKSSLGSGILAMPLAFSNAGLLVGTIGCVLIGWVVQHGYKSLVETSNEICVEIRQPSLEYADTCEQAFANGPRKVQKYSTAIRYFTDFTLLIGNIGLCSVYVVIFASSIKQIVQIYNPDVVIDKKYYVLMIMIPLMMISQLKNLKHIAPFSTLANFIFGVIICLTIYMVAQDLPDISERKLATPIFTYPTFISTSLFAMEGIGIVMYIENSMANPSHFLGCPGVMNISMSIVVILYTVVGFLGYWKYGSKVLGSIILNLDNNSIPAQVVKILLVCGMYFTYCMFFFIPTSIIWKYMTKFNVPEKWMNDLTNSIIRLLLVLLSAGIAVAIPDLGSIINLVGAYSLSTLGVFMPALAQTVFRWERDLGQYNWMLWKNVFLMIFATFIMIFGIVTTITRDLMKH